MRSEQVNAVMGLALMSYDFTILRYPNAQHQKLSSTRIYDTNVFFPRLVTRI